MTSQYDAWIGQRGSTTDIVTQRDVGRLAATSSSDHATLDGPDLAPLWHRLAFAPAVPHETPGLDGHPMQGHFLPPLHGRSRMWGGRGGHMTMQGQAEFQ